MWCYIKMVRNDSNQTTFKDSIRNISNQEINRNMFTDLFVVKRLNTYEDNRENSDFDELTCDIEQMNGVQRFQNVPWCSQGLGNGTGLIIPPRRGDIVCVIFYGQSNSPLIIGTVFNRYMQGTKLTTNENGSLVKTDIGNNDDIIDVGECEWILINKLNGAYIFTNADGDIKLKNQNGSFMLDKDGFVTINDAFTLPKTDGSNGQVMETNGSGVLSWENNP